jgi:uncharacterized protein YybS (DUF2232 family)
MGVMLGAIWKRGQNWFISIAYGSLLGSIGFFFRFWLLSILLGQDLWIYLITQVTELVEWGFVKLGLLNQPNLLLIQLIALIVVFVNNIIYLFVVHIVALLLLDRIGNSIPRPPKLVKILLDYD